MLNDAIRITKRLNVACLWIKHLEGVIASNLIGLGIQRVLDSPEVFRQIGLE